MREFRGGDRLRMLTVLRGLCWYLYSLDKHLRSQNFRPALKGIMNVDLLSLRSDITVYIIIPVWRLAQSICTSLTQCSIFILEGNKQVTVYEITVGKELFQNQDDIANMVDYENGNITYIKF